MTGYDPPVPGGRAQQDAVLVKPAICSGAWEDDPETQPVVIPGCWGSKSTLPTSSPLEIRTRGRDMWRCWPWRCPHIVGWTRRLQVSNVKWPLGSSSEKPRNSKVPLDFGIVPLTRRTVPSSCASGKHRQRYRGREGGWKAMDVELNVGRPTDAKTRGSRKWVPMQLRSHLGIYRIGCRAYLIGPRLCFLAPGSGCLCVPLQNFNVRPSIFITTIFTTIIPSPSSHQHLPNTICLVKREEKQCYPIAVSRHMGRKSQSSRAASTCPAAGNPLDTTYHIALIRVPPH